MSRLPEPTSLAQTTTLVPLGALAVAGAVSSLELAAMRKGEPTEGTQRSSSTSNSGRRARRAGVLPPDCGKNRDNMMRIPPNQGGPPATPSVELPEGALDVAVGLREVELVGHEIAVEGVETD